MQPADRNSGVGLRLQSPPEPRIFRADLVRATGSLADCHSETNRDAYYQRFARRIVRRNAVWTKNRSEDRRVLEETIIPLILSRHEPRTVLDIGRDPYEAFYNEFFAGRELWTIDRDAAKRPFGAENHIIGDAANLCGHFPEGCFDFILMNGVFGWGLNRPDAIEAAFGAIDAVLAPGGILVLGWNDTAGLVPVPLGQVQALRKLRPHFFGPLNGTSFRCSTFAHTYSFYMRARP